jgi:hypothetical protein
MIDTPIGLSTSASRSFAEGVSGLRMAWWLYRTVWVERGRVRHTQREITERATGPRSERWPEQHLQQSWSARFAAQP